MGRQTGIGVASPLTPSSAKRGEHFPPDIVRLLDVLVRIERRRQERLREMGTTEKRQCS
jgi:hypothetical protein